MPGIRRFFGAIIRMFSMGMRRRIFVLNMPDFGQ